MRFAAPRRLIAGALLVLLGAACSGPAPEAAPASGPPPPSSPIESVGTDLAWAQLTVALNERALQILHLVPDRAADPRLVTLAAALVAGHTGENAQLHRLLRDIGAPADNPHAGHTMPGMASPEQISAMAATRGAAFDQLLVSSLRDHLRQCHSLARSMRRSGRLPAALAIATTVEADRQRALDQLSPWPAPSATP